MWRLRSHTCSHRRSPASPPPRIPPTGTRHNEPPPPRAVRCRRSIDRLRTARRRLRQSASPRINPPGLCSAGCLPLRGDLPSTASRRVARTTPLLHRS
ncbi:hypothetical protein HU200_029576 [Digitaria exilis]|uniref:Uncharacterized protein n=1 Tax=Digitaria exilis TaxID=1010633 RepID=A0A835ERF8_9POAL|nr:hypothetical protein HU200_029576 [Digitaria exilis]